MKNDVKYIIVICEAKRIKDPPKIAVGFMLMATAALIFAAVQKAYEHERAE